MSFPDGLYDAEVKHAMDRHLRGLLDTTLDPEPTIVLQAKKVTCWIPVTQQQLDEAKELRDGIAENRARRAAMTPEQRAAEDAAWEKRRAAEKEARTCEHCGCDPDEHGGN